MSMNKTWAISSWISFLISMGILSGALRLTTPFLPSHFSPGNKIENCSSQFLAVCWIVRVEFKVHRLRDGFSVSNALLLSQSLPAFIGHNLDKIGDGTLQSHENYSACS